MQAFLITKAKPVYYWLYQLEYQKVFKNDISSVENFKKSVFEFISESNQATIIDYYLNLMAKDLNISIESLKNDFANYKPSAVMNNQNMNDIINEDIVQKTIVELKEVSVTKAVRRAYEIIIKHAIYSYDALVEYLNLTDKVFLGNDLLTEFEILQIISVESLIYPDLRHTKQYMKHNIDVLLNDNDLKTYVERVINDSLIDVKNKEDFNQSLNIVKKYIKKINTRTLKNRILKGDEKAIEEFTKSKIEENKI